VVPEPGEYYITPEGEPTQAPGAMAGARTLARLGIRGCGGRRGLHALMEGCHPRTGMAAQGGRRGGRAVGSM